MSTLSKIKDYWDGGGKYHGALHGVIEDGNLEDITLDAEIAEFERALVLLRHLRIVTYKTRWDACAAFWKDFAAASRPSSIHEGGEDGSC